MKAFPLAIDTGLSVKYEQGMELRDYFAAQAMLGEMLRDRNAGFVVIAEDAYALADEMMKARAE